MDLLDGLEAGSGIVCVIGAGGKKSTMMRLAQAQGERVALSATTRIPRQGLRGCARLLSFEGRPCAAEVMARLGPERVVAYAGAPARAERLEGLDPALIREVHDEGGFAATYVKADGARNRLAKAHGPGEPRLVPGAATVLLVASVRALGRPLEERVVHRHRRFAALAGARPGDAVTAAHLGAVLAWQLRELAGAGAAHIVAVVNMVDDDERLAAARAVAREVVRHGAPVRRLALTSMTAATPLREIAD